MLVIVTKREDAFVRPVEVGQKLAKRIRKFNGRCLERVEAVGVIDLADGVEHPAFGHKFGAEPVAEAAGLLG